MSLFNTVIVKTLPLVPKPVVGVFSRKYIAGPRIEDAMRVVRELNGQGVMGTVDVLGEEITNLDQAKGFADQYLALLGEIDRLHLDANISVKPTALGLKLDMAVCIDLVTRIVARAEELKSFVRLDMEDSSCTTDTITLYEEVRRRHSCVGMVIQAYLRRSFDDVSRLAATQTNFRLCKGIYVEPRRIAFKDPAIINMSFNRLLEEMFAKQCYVGVATHDEKLVWEAMRLADRHGIGRGRFEFQMLLGVDEELRRIIVDSGYRLRVYVPFGEQWYRYSVRRLKENPALAGQVFRNLVKSMVPG